jgi:ZIP family zinc transporter
LINYPELLLLGAVAGLTIFLGLPLAAIGSMSRKSKGFLNALATGILIFLTVDVFSHAWQSAEYVMTSALAGSVPLANGALSLIAMFGGIAIGLLGLTFYGTRYMSQSFVQSPMSDATSRAGNHALEQQGLQLVQQVNCYRLSMMIAIGIGAHNFSEGLAIGESYAQGALGFAIILVLGFAAHNATEGFGIAAPLSGLAKRPNIRFLALAGLVGGGPTFIGTALGSFWSSTTAYIFFLSVAGGALVYVTMLMYNAGRRQTTNDVLMIGFFFGILAGFITDLLVTLAGA